MSEWVLQDGHSGHVSVWHLDGVPWYEAPIPRRLHRCRAQTLGVIDGDHVQRCACGAIRLSRLSIRRTDPWAERNSRRGRWMDPLGTNPSNE